MKNDYQSAKVASIVTKDGLARLDAVKRKQQISRVSHDKKDWVNVSYENKDLAKIVGCKWCPVEKRWYATSVMSSKAVELWISEQVEKKRRRSR